MTAPIVMAATSKLESRFVVNALVPTLVFLPATAATLLHAVVGLPIALAWYTQLEPALLVLATIGALSFCWLIAALLASQWDRLVTFYEGYPLESLYRYLTRHPRLAIVGDIVYVPGKMAHQQRRERLANEVQQGRRLQSDLHHAYPDNPDDVLPTRLGNIIRAAELYPHMRYGIDFSILWTRLAMLLPEHLLKDLEKSIMQYQLPLVISAWSAILSAASLSLGFAGYFWTFAVVFGASVSVSGIGYYWSLRSAEHFGVAVRSVFDLHRGVLHEKWPQVMTAHVEREDFDRLQRFIMTGLFDKSQAAGSPSSLPIGQPIEDHARPPRTPVCRPYLVPTFRLSFLALLGSILIVYASWLFTTNKTIQVAVAKDNADLFHPVTVATGKMSLYDAGGLRAKSEANNAGASVRALTQIRAGQIVSKGEVARVDDTVETVLEIDGVGPGLGSLQTGAKVTLVFDGMADYASDPQCRAQGTAGVERLVSGQILVGPGHSGIAVVGASTGASLAMKCFGAKDVRMVGRL